MQQWIHVHPKLVTRLALEFNLSKLTDTCHTSIYSASDNVKTCHSILHRDISWCIAAALQLHINCLEVLTSRLESKVASCLSAQGAECHAHQQNVYNTTIRPSEKFLKVIKLGSVALVL